MSDKRISELVELTSLAADDELPVVDADANATKRITGANLSQFPSKVTAPSIEVADGGTIGSASDADAITIDATGNVSLSQALQLGDSTAISRLAADNFRLTADATSNGLLTAWERVDESTSSNLGAAVTESGGTFNVSSSGIWLIILNVFATADDDAGDAFVAARLEINGNSAGNPGVTDTGGGTFIASHNALFEVSNLSPSDDIEVIGNSISAGFVGGDTSVTETSIAFIRLGDA